MCVISYSGVNVDLPDKEERGQMFKTNPDGAGIMIDTGKENLYIKGLMTYEDFEGALAKIQQDYDLKKHPVALHFRIGTSGKKDGATTHPFLLSRNFGELRKEAYRGKQPMLMHNGVFSGFGGWLNPLASDTQDFAATIGYGLLRKTKAGRKPGKSMLKAAEKAAGVCRVIVFYADHDPILIGDWKEHSDNKIKYSNLNHRPSTITHYNTCHNTGPSYDHTAYTVPKANAYGKWEDVYLSNTRHWIQFSSEERLKDLSTSSTIKGMTPNRTITMNYSDTVYYEKPGLNFVTEKGLLDYNDYMEDLQINSQIDLYGEDFDENIIVADTPSELMEMLEMLEYNSDENCYEDQIHDEYAVKYYVDWEENIAYSTRALKSEFGEYWRHARRSLQELSGLEQDWTKGTPEMIKKLEDEIRKLNKKLPDTITKKKATA